MFTGIIEEVGTVVMLHPEGQLARLAVRAEVVRQDLRLGDSLATDGVCLTVERIEPEQLWLSIMPETLRRSTLGGLHPGDRVNLERALTLQSRLGGHLVTGHVDGISVLRHSSGVGETRVLTFTMPRELARFIAPQGSITVQGISLTVVDVEDETFSVSLVRHTLTATTLAAVAVGHRVNVEVDLIARYLDRLLIARETDGGLTMEKLRELGF